MPAFPPATQTSASCSIMMSLLRDNRRQGGRVSSTYTCYYYYYYRNLMVVETEEVNHKPAMSTVHMVPMEVSYPSSLPPDSLSMTLPPPDRTDVVHSMNNQ